tara:strand:+ start:121 stop:597 length:477 start_codon:yes stop_codon:yes gene_type:complete
MITEEIFNNMNLECVYENNNLISIGDLLKPYIIYVIKNDDKYYIGLTNNISNRIYQHKDKKTDTNGLFSCENKNNIKIYILEQFEDKIYLDLFEKIWIRWFIRYANCINKCKYKSIAILLLHPQYDNRKNANSNYYKFQKDKIITGSCRYNYDLLFIV